MSDNQPDQQRVEESLLHTPEDCPYHPDGLPLPGSVCHVCGYVEPLDKPAS